MAVKKKTTKNPAWDKVWVVSGEPCMARLSLESLLEDNGIKKIKYFYKDSDPKLLRSSLTTFSMIKDRAVVVHDPNAKMLELCLNAIEENTLVTKMLIIATIGGSLDGRSIFTLRANKNKRIMDFPYIEAKDAAKLSAHLKSWEQGSEVSINSNVKTWLYNNAPIIITKIKGQNGKKDAEVYDLVWLESELDKIVPLCKSENRNITIEDVEAYCDFNQVADIWAFIKNAIDGNYKQSNNLLTKLLDDQGLNSVLWLLYSQLAFLIQLKQFVNKYGNDINTIMDKMSYKHYLGKYCNNDWQEVLEVNEPAVNFYRIKKAMESSSNWLLEDLVNQYNAVTNAILDLRANGNESVIMPYLLLSLSGKANYSDPLYNRQ